MRRNSVLCQFCFVSTRNLRASFAEDKDARFDRDSACFPSQPEFKAGEALLEGCGNKVSPLLCHMITLMICEYQTSNSSEVKKPLRIITGDDRLHLTVRFNQIPVSRAGQRGGLLRAAARSSQQHSGSTAKQTPHSSLDDSSHTHPSQSVLLLQQLVLLSLHTHTHTHTTPHATITPRPLTKAL
jgi:hypothetical protein